MFIELIAPARCNKQVAGSACAPYETLRDLGEAVVDAALTWAAGAWKAMDHIIVAGWDAVLLRVFQDSDDTDVEIAIVLWPNEYEVGKAAAGRCVYRATFTTGCDQEANKDPITDAALAGQTWAAISILKTLTFSAGDQAVMEYPDPGDEKDGYEKALWVDVQGEYAMTVFVLGSSMRTKVAVKVVE